MAYITIGKFSERTRLSPKALRIYDELGLVVPAHVDPDSGYRLYSEEQVERARLVGLLRRLDMPLATIAAVLAVDGADSARAVAAWWGEVEALNEERRTLVAYIQSRLRGEDQSMYDIQLRRMPERTLVSVNRHVDAAGAGAFFDDAFTRLRAAGPGLEGIAGVPFVVYYGEVSDDSDGPIELCRAVDGERASAGRATAGLERRVEPAHDEAFIRLAKRDVGWPAMLPAFEALERWTHEHRRKPAGAPRQLLIADQRTATPDTLVCDLTVPLR
jgi:DNA-binding transcriptional MerR regulator